MKKSSSKILQILQSEFEHADSRRKLTQLLTSDIKQVNHYKVNRGAILGNHYHKETVEYFYITKGTFLMVLCSVINQNSVNRVLNKGSLVPVLPLLNHTIEALTNGEFMTFLTKAYSENDKDTYIQ